jgi:hypothetical protein
MHRTRVRRSRIGRLAPDQKKPGRDRSGGGEEQEDAAEDDEVRRPENANILPALPRARPTHAAIATLPPEIHVVSKPVDPRRLLNL